MQMLPLIEDGRIVLHLGGDIDADAAQVVAVLIDRSTNDFDIDFSDVTRVEEAGFSVLAEAIRRCPHKLVVRGLADPAPLGLPQPANW